MDANLIQMNEEGGLFGIWNHPNAAEITYYGLHALQHRGQDGAGIVTRKDQSLTMQKDLGFVNDLFASIDFSSIRGTAAIGHVRNAVSDHEEVDDVQPMLFRSQNGSMAIAHNGNIMNAYGLRGALEDEGSILQTNADTEILAHLIKRRGKKVTETAIIEALRMITGAYAFLILTEEKLYVAADPHGIRPLSIGRIGDAYVVSSETCAFNITGARIEREVLPGELITISNEGLISRRIHERKQRHLCAMEYVYFSRPDSDLNHVNVHASRKKMGAQLAREAPVHADVVTGIPDSSISAAIGYAEESGLPYEMGVIKNRYVGRTFIQPSQELREQGVKMKLSPVRGIVEGKRVVMIDDSLVRGTTCKRIVQMLKEAGAKEVHVRIASPPIQHPCYYGIDMSTKEELMAANHSVIDIQKIINADSLAFLSRDGLKSSIVLQDSIDQGICSACFFGNYSIQLGVEQRNFNHLKD